jgi:chemotaxis protein MotB
MRRARPIPQPHSDEDVPWASFADALAGLLFVFILLALSFAHQLQNATRQAIEKEKVAEDKASQALRAQEVARDLVAHAKDGEETPSVAACLSQLSGERAGTRVRAVPTVDEARLSLYLYDDGQASIEWFDSGSASLAADPCEVARAIGPCLERAFFHPELAKEDKEFRLRVFVEGHTDFIPVRGGVFPTNWELSGSRAAAVVRAFMVPDGRGASCNAAEVPARALANRTAAGELEVVAVGLADRRPAWRRLCDDVPDDPVCSCLASQQGKAESCGPPLAAAAVEQAMPPGLLPADQLIYWANQPEGLDRDARRKLLRRVDLRFEVAALSATGAGAPP